MLLPRKKAGGLEEVDFHNFILLKTNHPFRVIESFFVFVRYFTRNRMNLIDLELFYFHLDSKLLSDENRINEFRRELSRGQTLI